jgi:hypothetical protein
MEIVRLIWGSPIGDQPAAYPPLKVRIKIEWHYNTAGVISADCFLFAVCRAIARTHVRFVLALCGVVINHGHHCG